VEPGGLWDANHYEIRARIERDGKPAGEEPLHYAGTPSLFEAELAIGEPGTYVVTVYAYDPANGNTGLDRTTFLVR
jgi:hypothetical protein